MGSNWLLMLWYIEDGLNEVLLAAMGWSGHVVRCPFYCNLHERIQVAFQQQELRNQFCAQKYNITVSWRPIPLMYFWLYYPTGNLPNFIHSKNIVAMTLSSNTMWEMHDIYACTTEISSDKLSLAHSNNTLSLRPDQQYRLTEAPYAISFIGSDH